MDMSDNTEEININQVDYNSDYLSTNFSFNLEKINEVTGLLKKASKGLFLPVKKMFHFYFQELTQFKKKFKSMKKSIEKNSLDSSELKPEKENNVSNPMTAEESDKLSNLMTKVLNVVNLFNNLFNSDQFDDLVKALPDPSEIKKDILSKDVSCFNDEEGTKTKKFLGKKKRRNEVEGGDNKEATKKQKSKLKKNNANLTQENSNEGDAQQEEENSTPKKRISEEEATEEMKTMFAQKFKGITKTFLTRKLTKNVIWSNEFDLTSEDPFKDQREIVKSATYKYTKVTVNFSGEPLKIITYIKEVYKNWVLLLSKDQITIGGEMKGELEQFLEHFKTSAFLTKHKISLLSIQVYAFFEEIFSQFDTDDESFVTSFSEEEVENLKKEWQVILEMREQWKLLRNIK